jgi:hypothetical protein
MTLVTLACLTPTAHAQRQHTPSPQEAQQECEMGGDMIKDAAIERDAGMTHSEALQALERLQARQQISPHWAPFFREIL